MIAEGNETPGGESGGTGGRRSEGDLLAERRARRAAESGEHALTMRAEATVRTLETHVASLQQRLGDAEQESRRIADLLDAERSPRLGERAAVQPAGESAQERELQRASQREYAEQRLRVEAEDRSFELERESRSEVDRLSRRLSASERETQALGARLEILQRELAEAEQAAATERSAMLRSERALRARLGELEGTAQELHAALETERAARRRAEYLLDALRDAQRGALGLLGGLADTIARLRRHFDAPSPPTPAVADMEPPPAPIPPVAATTQPLGRAVSPPPAVQPQARLSATPQQSAAEVPDEVRSAEMAEALAAAVERLRARVEQQEQPDVERTEPVARRPSHKHSMSLI
ncbi:MAG: hypothetical protein ACYDHT_06565, partial [Solirubrobacteraceae bacterium]